MIHTARRSFLLSAAIACLFTLLLVDQLNAGRPWARFRGPNCSGAVEGTDGPRLPLTWTDKDYRWRVKLSGGGLSAPVIWGDRVFVTAASPEGESIVISCRRTSNGSEIWKRSFAVKDYPQHRINNLASSTPVLDENNVYMSWATPEAYTVVALGKAEGKPLWRRDLGPFVSEHGFGASPILVDEMLIVPNDQEGKSSIIALDRRTGKTRWAVPRKVEHTAFSTPCVYRPPQGPAQLILAGSTEGVTSLDPSTGKKNWELPVFKSRVVGSPIVCSGLILVGCGSGGGGKLFVAVRPGDAATGTKAEVVYDLKKAIPYVVTPVARGDRVFLWTDSGIVSCMDAPSGKILWRKRIGGKFLGSPVRVGDRLYCISREGKMIILAADDKFQPPLGEVDLGEASSSTPAVCDGVMYIRTSSHLMAIEGE